MYDVVTIGSATRDAFFKAKLNVVPFRNTLSKKAYVLPLGEKLEVEDILFTVGGNAVNASITFARQGFKVACAGKVGDDVSGEEIRRRLRKEKIDTNFLAIQEGDFTAYSVLLLDKGERTILGYHGAADTFTLSDLSLKQMQAKWWYVSLAGESYKLFSSLIRFARKNKIAFAFNPTGYHLSHKRNDILRSLSDLSFLVLNDEEASRVAGISWKKEKEVFKKLDALVPGILAVTEGKKGVTVSDGKHIYAARTFREKKILDRTGAGDAFGSGFVAGLLKRGITFANISEASTSDIAYAIRLGTANATAVVEHIGATEGILSKRAFQNEKRFKHLPIKISTL